MEFNSAQPIYLQIADMICEKILRNEWGDGERIPSVRDLAVSIEVNPNTVMRTFTFLQEKNIISNQRGIGYFVSKNGSSLAKSYKTEQFIKTDLVNVFRTMELLGIGIDEIKRFYTEYENSGGAK